MLVSYGGAPPLHGSPVPHAGYDPDSRMKIILKVKIISFKIFTL